MDCFDDRKHICIVTELLSVSVFDFLKANSYAPFPDRHIQSFARQLLDSVACSLPPSLRSNRTLTSGSPSRPASRAYRSQAREHSSRRRLVSRRHSKGAFFPRISFDCDDVTLAQHRPGQNVNASQRILDDSSIRLIDFGSATFAEDYHASVVSTRHYRAPEIILGAPLSGFLSLIVSLILGHRPRVVLPLRCLVDRLYSRRTLHRRGALPNSREPRAPGDDGDGLWQAASYHGEASSVRISRPLCWEKGRVDVPHRPLRPEWLRGTRLDWPQATTSRQSKKFVKGVQKLEVRRWFLTLF